MEGCLINPLKEVGKCIFTETLWPPVKRHIDYWWCFDGNVQGLRDQIGCLEMERRNMDGKIEEARLRAERPTTEVENWSNEGTQKLKEAERILQGCVYLKGWNIKSRYLVGKSAKEIAEGIAKLRNEGNLIRIADPAPPAAMVPISHAPTLEFQSRKRIEDDIMESLKDGVRMIAICGPGGVGKTTMVKRIVDMLRKEFDEVVTVVVSQQIDMFKIQKQIAEMLGLDLSEDTLGGRAHKLRTRLMDLTKKLIIFDDVWKSLELEDIGVPYGGCKVILTSRLKDVCEEMEAKVIEIQVLDKKEAWTLFKEKSGDCVDDSDLRPIAEEVAAECKGLPIALVTVGKALQKKNINIWKDALSQLRGASPMNFPQVLKNVYMPLKLSYDFLETETEKSLFLLCCLFPEDYNIQIEDLALLSFGLGLLEGINNIEDGRNRTYHLLARLRSRFLLMTGAFKEYVKMHDVVRDVAIFIGSKEKQGFLKCPEVSSKDSSSNCNWMSVDISIANAKLPVGSDFPNLRLLMISNSKEGFDVNDICFKGMKELAVLHFSDQSFQSLPSSLKFLKKLRKLLLFSCKVKDISVVGELTSLEILRIRWCDEIEELPADVGELKSLRLLELRNCEKLVFRNCSTVEKLVNAVDCKFPMLEHLELRKLRELEEIIDGTIPEGSNSFQKLESIYVRDCHKLGYLWKSPNQNVYLVNLKSIYICDCPNLRYLFSMETARSLVQLESLGISDCETMEQVFWNEVESNTEASIIELFPKLMKLKLFDLPNLLAFTQGVEIIKFPQLIEVQIEDCPKLRTKIDKYPTCMIKKLLFRKCDTIEEIFRDDGNRHIIFQELYELQLDGLPCLTTLCGGVESIKFPKLKKFWVGDLPRLNSFVAIDSEPTHDHHSLHFFCNEKVEIIGLVKLTLWQLSDKISKIWCRHIRDSFFHNLQSLYIYEVNGIRNLILFSIAKALDNLKNLQIHACKEMVDMIEDEIEDEIHVTINPVFPNLESLEITSNYKLRSFCQWKHAFELPSLENVQIADCPLMKTFTLGSLSTPKLHRFKINRKDIEMKDLNGGIHHFISTETTNKDENKDEYNEDEKHEYSAEDKKEIEGEEKTESSNNNLM